MASGGGSAGKGRSGLVFALVVLVAVMGSGRMREHLVWIVAGIVTLAVIIPIARAVAASGRRAGQDRRPATTDSSPHEPQPGTRLTVERQEQLKAEIRSRLTSSGVPLPALQIMQPFRQNEQPAAPASFARYPSPRTTVVQRRSPAPARRAAPIQRDRQAERAAEFAPGSEIDLDDAVPTVRPGADINLHDITPDLPAMAAPAMAATGSAAASVRPAAAQPTTVRPARDHADRPRAHEARTGSSTSTGSSAIGGWTADPSILGSTLSASSVLSPAGSALTSTSLTRGDGV
ncbi:MAG: hypothetical protein LKI24_03420 [Acidipropionibacterium sp.]|jgi:hypothetical protein|nr:hypothetical protein [Acidipropionibacterium sp.]